jgi:hypothetical protein
MALPDGREDVAPIHKMMAFSMHLRCGLAVLSLMLVMTTFAFADCVTIHYRSIPTATQPRRTKA